MAAITNRDNWKQTWMQRAERITDVWDIIKAWCGRSAEVVLSICMFASIIGVLPGIHYWDFMNNVILSIQIIMLDMGGFALNTMAEHARDQGQDQAATKAERMATFLIGLVIATIALITIGQLSSIAGQYAAIVKKIVDYTETALILVRVVSTVQYIHVIHSLRGSTIQPTHIPTQPTQSPTHDEKIDQLEATIQGLQQAIETLEKSSTIQLSTPPTQVVEVPTHDLHTTYTATIQPISPLARGKQANLKMLTQVATSTAREEEQPEEEIIVDADTEPVQAIVYPSVSGVSPAKVKQLIDAHLAGTGWRDMPGNYSQTVKPVRDAWEAMHGDESSSLQNV